MIFDLFGYNFDLDRVQNIILSKVPVMKKITLDMIPPITNKLKPLVIAKLNIENEVYEVLISGFSELKLDQEMPVYVLSEKETECVINDNPA